MIVDVLASAVKLLITLYLMLFMNIYLTLFSGVILGLMHCFILKPLLKKGQKLRVINFKVKVLPSFLRGHLI
jgi:hypothetical protein